jgi:hypothetical protein
VKYVELLGHNRFLADAVCYVIVLHEATMFRHLPKIIPAATFALESIYIHNGHSLGALAILQEVTISFIICPSVYPST